jgi:hypothetical protein
MNVMARWILLLFLSFVTIVFFNEPKNRYLHLLHIFPGVGKHNNWLANWCCGSAHGPGNYILSCIYTSTHIYVSVNSYKLKYIHIKHTHLNTRAHTQRERERDFMKDLCALKFIYNRQNAMAVTAAMASSSTLISM